MKKAIFEQQKKTNETLVEKWTKNRLFDEARYSALSEKRKIMVSAMLEATEKSIMEGTTTSDVAVYVPLLIPVLRRLIPGLIAFDLCGTQPLQMQSGLIFAIIPTFTGKMDSSFKAANSQILKINEAITGLKAGDVLLQGKKIVDPSDASATIDSTTARGIVESVNKNGKTVLLKLAQAADKFVATLPEVDPSSPTHELKVYKNNTDGAEWSATTAGTTGVKVEGTFENIAMWDVLIENYSGPYATANGEYLGREIREMGFRIEKKQVTAETHKLKARYSLELETDLKNTHGLNAEEEIQNFLSAQISTEINAVLLNKMKELAITGGMITYDYSTISSGDGRWEMEKYVNLISKIEGLRNEIFRKTRRGKANFIFGSPNAVSILTILSKGMFEAPTNQPSAISSDYDPNNGYAGMFMGMKVFVDPWAEEDYLVVGYKGSSEFDAGLFFCPYVPLQAVKTTEQDTGNPVVFLSSRYGYTDSPFGGENYFRFLKIQNIPFYN